MSRVPFYVPTEGELDTEIDSPEWTRPIPVHVSYVVTADEVRDITVTDCEGNGEERALTPQQERGLIEEIWEDYAQNGDS